MRKRLKRKRRACGLCKPGKKGISNRWTDQQEAALREWERDRQELKRR